MINSRNWLKRWRYPSFLPVVCSSTSYKSVLYNYITFTLSFNSLAFYWPNSGFFVQVTWFKCCGDRVVHERGAPAARHRHALRDGSERESAAAAPEFCARQTRARTQIVRVVYRSFHPAIGVESRVESMRGSSRHISVFVRAVWCTRSSCTPAARWSTRSRRPAGSPTRDPPMRSTRCASGLQFRPTGSTSSLRTSTISAHYAVN